MKAPFLCVPLSFPCRPSIMNYLLSTLHPKATAKKPSSSTYPTINNYHMLRNTASWQ